MENTFWKIILFWLVLTHPGTISEKVVVKSGDMRTWFYKSLHIGNGSSGEMWSDPKKYALNSSRTCGGSKSYWLFTKYIGLGKTFADFVHVNIEAELTLYDSGTRYRSLLQVYVYRGNNGINIRTVTKEKAAAAASFISRYFTPVYTLTNTSKSKNVKGRGIVKENQTFPLYLNKTEGVQFGIKSKGTCAEIFKMKLYYYYCKEKFINSVKFENTISPLNGSKEVAGSCSDNSSLSKDITSLKGFCQSNGIWSVNENIKCLCKEGFEPHTWKGCLPCGKKYFKQNPSNENCTRCPLNSVPNENKTQCRCKDDYYKRPNDHSRNCYGLIQVKLKLKCESKGTSVNITWNEPERQLTDESLRYDINCSFCDGKHCNRTCSKEKYHPNQYNITQTFVKVSGLKPGGKYVFKVYPKNSLNKKYAKEKWNFTETVCDVKAPGNNEKNIHLYIIIGAIGLLVFNVVIILIIFMLKRRGGRNSTNEYQVELLHQTVFIDPSIYERAEDALTAFTSELERSVISLETLIGGGEFGNVYKGELKRGNGETFSVAVKTLKREATEKSAKDFILEASIMGQFHDPNVVRLEGVVTKTIPRMIILEFMSNGSLDHFLHNNGNLTQLQLMSMARDVASGMKYLAAINFVHRDLAARNILVDERLLCKIADFGLSRSLDLQESSQGEYAGTGGKIPIRWTALEAIKLRKFSSASDVWSYGILLWEIMTFCQRPYWDWDNFRVIREIEIGYRLPAPKDCPRTVHELMMQCWNENRNERPTFEYITQLINCWISSPEAMNDGLRPRSIALSEWLHSIKMGNYSSRFIGAGYENPYQLSPLSDEDLRELGITLIGHRNKILKGIRALENEQNGNVHVGTPTTTDV